MLEQAIVDAAALREAALKNAEQSLIEKYAPQIKEAVAAMLENTPTTMKYENRIVSVIHEADIDGNVTVAESDGKPFIVNESELQEAVDIEVGAPEDNPAFIDVEKKEVTPEEEVEDFTISGQDKTGRNRAYTDYKDIEKNLITAFDDLDDPQDRQMFKEYLLTNLKLYFERFEEELQTDLPEPDIETPAGADVVDEPPAEDLGLGLQEDVANLNMEEIVEWLLSSDTKK